MTEISTNNSFKRKIVILGDGSVGKTSLIRRFVINKFDDKYLATVGTKVTEKNLVAKIDENETMNLRLMIWDFMGQKGFRKIERSGLNGTTGAIIVYDISRAETLANIENYWVPVLQETVPGTPMVFLANKVDLLPELKNTGNYPEATSIEDFQYLLNKYEATGYLTSALTGKNVESAFIGLGKLLIKNISKNHDNELLKEKKSQLNDKYETAISRAIDLIIMDFHRDFGGDFEETMTIIRKQFEKAGVDINNPTTEGLRKAIDHLSNVERSFWSMNEVAHRKQKRLTYLNQINKTEKSLYL